jgi:hypothetical protein
MTYIYGYFYCILMFILTKIDQPGRRRKSALKMSPRRGEYFFNPASILARRGQKPVSGRKKSLNVGARLAKLASCGKSLPY